MELRPTLSASLGTDSAAEVWLSQQAAGWNSLGPGSWGWQGATSEGQMLTPRSLRVRQGPPLPLWVPDLQPWPKCADQQVWQRVQTAGWWSTLLFTWDWRASWDDAKMEPVLGKLGQLVSLAESNEAQWLRPSGSWEGEVATHKVCNSWPWGKLPRLEPWKPEGFWVGVCSQIVWRATPQLGVWESISEWHLWLRFFQFWFLSHSDIWGNEVRKSTKAHILFWFGYLFPVAPGCFVVLSPRIVHVYFTRLTHYLLC